MRSASVPFSKACDRNLTLFKSALVYAQVSSLMYQTQQDPYEVFLGPFVSVN